MASPLENNNVNLLILSLLRFVMAPVTVVPKLEGTAVFPILLVSWSLINSNYSTLNTKIGNTDISNIGITITGAIVNLAGNPGQVQEVETSTYFTSSFSNTTWRMGDLLFLQSSIPHSQQSSLLNNNNYFQLGTLKSSSKLGIGMTAVYDNTSGYTGRFFAWINGDIVYCGKYQSTDPKKNYSSNAILIILL